MIVGDDIKNPPLLLLTTLGTLLVPGCKQILHGFSLHCNDGIRLKACIAEGSSENTVDIRHTLADTFTAIVNDVKTFLQ